MAICSAAEVAAVTVRSNKMDVTGLRSSARNKIMIDSVTGEGGNIWTSNVLFNN